MGGLAVGSDPISAHGARDILDLVFADVLKADIDLALGLHIGGFGNRYAAGFRQAFQARRHVDPVTIDGAVALLENIAQVHTDAKQHLAIVRQVGVALSKIVLHIDGTSHRLDDALKGRQHAVACGIDHIAVMRRDMLAKDATADIEHVHGRPLVVAHNSPLIKWLC